MGCISWSIKILLLSVFFVRYAYSQEISPGVRLIKGSVNGFFIERNGKNLVVYGDPKGELKKADFVLFTHFRRDVIWAGRELVVKSAHAVAPAAERQYFTRGDSIWRKFPVSQFHDYSNQTTRIGIAPLDVYRFVREGDTLNWEGIPIRVLDTPGYTRGSVSYIADIEGKRFAFTGDLIFGGGKIFDLYSFQDSLRGIDGYHGYAVRLGQLIKSLNHLADQKSDFLIPARGPVINNPNEAISRLIERIRALYENYLSITAQRWNHTDRMITLSNHILGEPNGVEWMPFATVIENNPPSWYHHINNSNLIMAEDSTAFLVDCGTKKSLEELLKLKQSGRLKKVEGLFITHYHDDHTDLVNEIVREFGCPVYATKELKTILENPAAFHMPCLSAIPSQNLTIMKEGQKISWKNFALTFFYFPGQTLYHDGLLCEKSNGEAIFFAGDSFSPAGIDDYCFQNRNLLHPGTGYFYCMDFLKKLPPHVLLCNQHIQHLFRFSPQQLDHMTTVLQKRIDIIKDLIPWDDVNYGTDDHWVSIFPYTQKLERGQTVSMSVKIFNHSNVSKTFAIEPVAPKGFIIQRKIEQLVIGPRMELEQTFKVKISQHALPGIYLLLLNVKVDDWDLREWSEAYIELSEKKP